VAKPDRKLPLYRAAAGVLVLALAALGLPQTIDSAWRLRAGAGADLFRLDLPPGQDLAPPVVAYGALESLDRRLGDPAARIDAGIARAGLPAAAAGADGADTANDAAAAADFERGLTRLPANAYGWYELALVRYRLGDLHAALTALRTSEVLGFYDPALNLARTWLGLHLWLVLDESDVRLLKDEARFAWRSSPRRLVAMARSDGWVAGIVRGALDEDAQTEFDAALSHP
jgi:hypothetical protein